MDQQLLFIIYVRNVLTSSGIFVWPHPQTTPLLTSEMWSQSRAFLMTSVRIALLVRKLWSADSAGWTGRGHVLRDWHSAVHVIMWPTSSDVVWCLTIWRQINDAQWAPVVVHDDGVVDHQSSRYSPNCNCVAVYTEGCVQWSYPADDGDRGWGWKWWWRLGWG